MSCGLPAEAKRVALVIGNDSYQSVTALHNARSDAKAVAKALEATGFAVTLKQDLTLKAMKETLRAFKAQVAGGDEAVFYFSGHGVQFDGANYLIPIDIVTESEEQVADESVPLQRVLDDLHEQKARFTLAIVDACRNNPFKGKGRAIGGRGLAPVAAASGQMVLYSAGAGQEALDRLGPQDQNPNGVFTRVFIQEIKKPGVSADRLLRNVRDQVVVLAKSVPHEQVPALYDQTIGEFYFLPRAGGGSAAVGTGTEAVARHVESATELEQSYWDRIKDSTEAADFTDYKKQYPSGPHAAEAALLFRKLSRAPAAPPAQAPVAAPAPAAAAAAPPAPKKNSPVEARAVGTWLLYVQNPKGTSTWYWDIRDNGNYSFWSEGPGAVASHSGTVRFADGKWTLSAPTANWADVGTYQMPNPNTLVATGKLGTAYWQRRL